MHNYFGAVGAVAAVSLLICSSNVVCQWARMPGPNPFYGISMLHFKEYGWWATDGDKVYRLKHDGSILDTVIVPGADLGAVSGILRVGSDLYINGGWGVFHSTDGGEHWTHMRSNVDSVYFVECLLEHQGTLYAGARKGFLKLIDSIWMVMPGGNLYAMQALVTVGDRILGCSGTRRVLATTNGGQTWEHVYGGLGTQLPHRLYYVNNILIASENSSATFRSLDSGRTWERSLFSRNGATLRNESIDGVLGVGEVLFAANEGAVYRSTDAGLTWYSMNEGLVTVESNFVQSITLYNDTVYIGTSDWIYMRPLSELMPPVTDVEEVSPGVFLTTLGQSIPNPANAEVIIPYTLASSGHVTLAMFNAVGQQVATPIDEQQSAGARTAAVNTSSLPAGVYYYRLSVGGVVLTRSMVIAR